MASVEQQNELREAIKSGDQNRVKRAEQAAMSNSGSERDRAGTTNERNRSRNTSGPTKPLNNSPAGSLEDIWAQNIANFKANVVDKNPGNADVQNRWNQYQSVLDKYGQGNVFGAISSGELPATAKGDYRGYDGTKEGNAGREYQFDWQTGKATGNLNMGQAGYDLMRDKSYNYLDGYREQAFANEYAKLVQNGQLEDTPETRAWYNSYKTGWNEKMQDGWQTNGRRNGDTTAYVPLKSTGLGTEPGNNLKSPGASPQAAPQANPQPQAAPQQQAPQNSPSQQPSFVSTIDIRDANGNIIDKGYVAADGTSYVKGQGGSYVPTRQAYQISGYDSNTKTATVGGPASGGQGMPQQGGYQGELLNENAAYQSALDKYTRQLEGLDVEDFIDLARDTYDPMRKEAQKNINDQFASNNRAAEIEAEARGLSGSDLVNVRRTSNADTMADAVAEMMANYNSQVNTFATEQYNNARGKLTDQMGALDKQYGSRAQLLQTLLGDQRDQEKFTYTQGKDAQDRSDALAKQAWTEKTTAEQFAYEKWLGEEKLKLDKKALEISARKSSSPSGPTSVDLFNAWGAVTQSVQDALSPGNGKAPDVALAQNILRQAVNKGVVNPQDASYLQDTINQAGYRMLAPAGVGTPEKKSTTIPGNVWSEKKGQ